MKRTIFAAVFLFAVFMLNMNVSALTYTDDMTTLFPDQIRQLSGLKLHYFSGVPRPDYTAVTPELHPPVPAYAEYRVRSATSVTAYLYSPGGTFAAFDSEANKYRLGLYSEILEFDPSRAPPQAMLCPSSGEVYTEADGIEWLTLDASGSLYSFESSDSQTPAGEKTGYGVNIYYSVDGGSFTRASAGLSYVYYDHNNAIYYEAYTAAVPETAQYIRVSLNDMSFIKHEGEQSPRPYDANSMTGVSGLSLAAVKIFGPSFVPGVYDEEVAANLPPASSEPEPERETIVIIRDSSSRASARSASSQASSAASSSRSSPSSTPKFTGVITVPASSASSSRAASSRQSSSGASGSKPPPTPAPASPPDAVADIPLASTPLSQDSITVEQIDSGSGSETFNRGVTAYIIVGLAGLVGLMLFKPKA